MGPSENSIPDSSEREDVAIPGVRVRSDLAYAGDSREGHLLNLHWSVEAESPLPLVIYFNSNSFVRSDKNRGNEICKRLAKRGFAVANTEFRNLRREVTIADELEDMRSLVDWICENKGSFGFDTNRVYAIGTGYGATMALWLTLLCSSGRCRKAAGIEEPGIRIRGLGLFQGKTDLDGNDPYLKKIRLGLKSLDKELEESLVVWNNHDIRTIPPVFQVVCEHDPARSDSLKLDGLLETNKVAHELLDFGTPDIAGKMFMEKKTSSNEAVRAVSRMFSLFDDNQ